MELTEVVSVAPGALYNLLANAVKFTPAVGTVYLGSSFRDEGSVRITVADTGKGIAEEHQAHIFD